MPKSSAFQQRGSASSDEEGGGGNGNRIYEHYSLDYDNSWTFAGLDEVAHNHEGIEDPKDMALEAFYTCFEDAEEEGRDDDDDIDDDEARCDVTLSHYQLSVKEIFDKNQQFCNALQLYELVGQHATDSDIQRM